MKHNYLLKGLSLVLFLLITQSAIADSSLEVNLEEGINVISNYTISKKTKGANIDAPISTFTHLNNLYWVLPNVYWQMTDNVSDFSVWHSITRGPLDQPAREFISSNPQWDFLPPIVQSELHNGRKWITNTYQHSTGLLAFIHTEYAKNGTPNTTTAPGHTRVGIAWSNGSNAMPAFDYLGHIVEPYTDPEPFNIQGVPYLIKNENGTDYFYIYFHDYSSNNNGWGHIALAKSPVDNVLHRARLGQTTNWYKYNKGNWTRGLGGKSSPLGLWPIISHGDAAKSEYNNMYYFAGTVPTNWAARGAIPTPSEIIIYESCDAINWRESLRFAQNPNPDIDLQYVSIVNKDGTDNGVVGNEFYIYVVHKFHSNPKEYNLLRFPLNVIGGGCD